MKLLVVDDSYFSQRITGDLLKKSIKDSEIYYAGDGEEGFKKYKSISPDYIFIDLLMPKMNGEELIKVLKEYDSNAKIFVVTADVQKSVKNEIEQYNILAFINKPFSAEKAKFISDLIRKDKENE